MAEKPLAFINYQKFQWLNNLKTMRNFEGSLNFLDEENRRTNATVTETDLFSSNVFTIKHAIHYTATDLPTLFSGSYLQYPLSALSALGRLTGRGGSPAAAAIEASEILSPEQGLIASRDLFLSFCKSLSAPSSLSLLLRESKDLDQCLSAYKPYLIWGTTFMDDNSK